jgi:OmpA-OmpF porin, OOP family
MRFFLLAGGILLIAAVGLGLAIEHGRKPAPLAAPAAKPSARIIGLPNGATLTVGPNSVGEQIAHFLESNDPGPRRFEPGGREFDDWSSEPTPESQARLVGFTQLLKAYPDVAVQIIGYTDNMGDPAANQKLSRERAEDVARRLVANGIAAKRLSASGMGMAQPIADNRTEEGRALNRRVAIILTRHR